MCINERDCLFNCNHFVLASPLLQSTDRTAANSSNNSSISRQITFCRSHFWRHYYDCFVLLITGRHQRLGGQSVYNVSNWAPDHHHCHHHHHPPKLLAAMHRGSQPSSQLSPASLLKVLFNRCGSFTATSTLLPPPKMEDANSGAFCSIYLSLSLSALIVSLF